MCSPARRDDLSNLEPSAFGHWLHARQGPLWAVSDRRLIGRFRATTDPSRVAAIGRAKAHRAGCLTGSHRFASLIHADSKCTCYGRRRDGSTVQPALNGDISQRASIETSLTLCSRRDKALVEQTLVRFVK